MSATGCSRWKASTRWTSRLSGPPGRARTSPPSGKSSSRGWGSSDAAGRQLRGLHGPRGGGEPAQAQRQRAGLGAKGRRRLRAPHVRRVALARDVRRAERGHRPGHQARVGGGMERYFVFARTEYDEPLEHRGDVEANDVEEARGRALERYGEEWLEMSLVPVSR